MPSVINEHTQYLDSAGVPLASGSVYIGTQNLNPVTNTITIYSDRDLTTSISNPQTLDANGRTTNKIWVPGKYSIQVNDSDAVQQYQELDVGDSTSSGGVTLLDTVAGTNTITAQGAEAPITALSDTQQYNFKAANANTAAVTLQIDTTGAKAIKKFHDQDLASGDIQQDQIVAVIYNSTDDVFELVSSVATASFTTISTTGDATIGGTANVAAGLLFDETADHSKTPAAAKGEIWLKSDTPNRPQFTDDAGTDFALVVGQAAPTNHVRAGNKYLVNGDVSITGFQADAAITEDTFETIGPTGSGADNIIADMDDMPSTARIGIFLVGVGWTADANTNAAGIRLHAAAGDATVSTPVTATTSIAQFNTDPNSNSHQGSFETVIEVPLDSSQTFKFTWSGTNQVVDSVFLYYRGFISD